MPLCSCERSNESFNEWLSSVSDWAARTYTGRQYIRFSRSRGVHSSPLSPLELQLPSAPERSVDGPYP